MPFKLHDLRVGDLIHYDLFVPKEGRQSDLYVVLQILDFEISPSLGRGVKAKYWSMKNGDTDEGIFWQECNTIVCRPDDF